MILSCSLAGRQCSGKDFEWVYDFYLGKCYTINSDRDSKGNQLMILNKLGGLYLELIINSYKQDIRETETVTVFLSDLNEYALANQENFISQGFYSSLSLANTIYKKLGKP